MFFGSKRFSSKPRKDKEMKKKEKIDMIYELSLLLEYRFWMPIPIKEIKRDILKLIYSL
jgi:hypothetical protein